MRDGLRHPEAEERRRSVAALSGPEVSSVLSDLYALLDDPDWRVRREVALALARLRDVGPALDPLLDAVVMGDVSRRNAAIEALRQIGTNAADSVLRRLERTQGPARRFLIEVLSETGTDACVAVLARMLDDTDGNIPPAAAETLGRIRGPAASKALRHALEHADPVVRLAAIQAFGTRDEALAWIELEPLLADPMCRRAALRAAAACAEPEALAAIVHALAGGQGTLVGEAAVACSIAARRGRTDEVRFALQHTGGVAAALRSIAQRGLVAEVHRAVIQCLGLVAEPAGIVPVLQACQWPETSAAADEALGQFDRAAVPFALASASQLGSQSKALMLRWALERAGEAEREAVVGVAWDALSKSEAEPAAWDAIATIGATQDAERLVTRLETHGAPSLDPAEFSGALRKLIDRHPALAERLARAVPAASAAALTIAAAVAAAGHPIDVDPLLEAMKSTDPHLRVLAVRALAYCKHPGARDALEYGLADEDPTVQAAAAESLNVGGAGRELLEQSLRASEPRVRQAAARALSRAGGNIRAALLPALDDPEPAVVLAVLEGLGAHATVDDLTGLTTHSDPDVASDALARLRAAHPAAASDAAQRMLDHPAWAVRLEAVRSIDTAKPDHAAAMRQRRARERDEMVREAIDSALARTEGKAAG